MIADIKIRWKELDKKKYSTIGKEFSISSLSAKKYVKMSDDEIRGLDNPTIYKKRITACDNYICLIYKMMKDNIRPEVIYSYCIRNGYDGSRSALENHITHLLKNNFNITLAQGWTYNYKYEDDVTVIKRNEILKFITVKNEKIKIDENVVQYIDAIKEKYPIVTELENIYNGFHTLIMGDNPNKLDEFIDIYEESSVKSFVNGLKKDIAPVKNAISHETSSGFVEGNNNKFKLLKRILYGRSGLVNLFRKCYIAFMMNNKDFEIEKLIIPPKINTISRGI